MWVAGKMGRISAEDRDAAVRNFLNIEITKTNIGKIFESLLTIATEHNRSCYDAAYLTLAEVIEAPLVTGDERLYDAVKDKISSVAWIEDV